VSEWKLIQERVIKSFGEEIKIPAEWQMLGKIGNDFESSNAVTMELQDHYNGSGEQAFGGAHSWPAITLKVGLQTGEEKIRDDLAKLLRDTVEQFMKGRVRA